MCPPGCAAPAVLPALPSCPELLAHLADVPGSAGLYPLVAALALRETHTDVSVTSRDAHRHRQLDTTFLSQQYDKADSFRGPEGEETSVSRGLGAGNG